MKPGPGSGAWSPVLLALISRVAGWLLIANVLPRLPAVETSILLLGQPVGAVMWGVIFFNERLSSLQWAGALLVVGGVAAFSLTGAFAAKRRASRLAEQ